MSHAALASSLLALALLGAAPAAAQPRLEPPAEAAADAADPDRVRVLLRAMGQDALAARVVRRTLDGLRQSLPQVPAAFWADFEAAVDPEELLELQVEAYAGALSAEDVEGLIAFYRSPLGRRFVEAQPAIVDGVQAAGERWGQALARRALRALKAEGY